MEYRIRLLKLRTVAPGNKIKSDLKLDEIKFLIEKSKEIILNQPNLLELEAPVKIVGDIHGQVLLIILFSILSFFFLIKTILIDPCFSTLIF